MLEESTTNDLFIIQDLETLKVIADPLRKQILEVLIPEMLTVKQVADRLGLAPSKLYYHFNLMEQHGLIRVVETRQVANMLEKWYQATASNLEVDPGLLSFSTSQGKENLYMVLAADIDATREDLLRSLAARTFQLDRGAPEHPRRAMISRQIGRLPDQRAEEFFQRLTVLMEEFEVEVKSQEQTDLPTYALTVAFYPSFYYGDEGQSPAQ